MNPAHASRQVLRRAALRARRVRRSIERLISRRRLSLSKLALTVGWMMASPALLANPSGGQVVDGRVQITQGAPGTLNLVQTTDRAIINWQSFGIGVGETVNFHQPSARSVVLNRVLGNDPSAIFGQLAANGTVMLVNPNGIVFGPTARVDVGGLVATTANIRNDDFMAGRDQFGEASAKPNAVVDNQGRISIRESGLAALVAPHVRNSGVIEARLGRVALGAANRFTLDFHGDGLLSFSAGSAVTEAQAQAQRGVPLVLNDGEIRADGGSVLLSAQAVKGVVDEVIHTRGIVAATSVSGAGGRIVLSGGDAGTVTVAGQLDTTSATGQGGTIIATGEHARVAGSARLDASGLHGGGEIALGSTGLTNPGKPFDDKSRSVDVASGARLRADALAQGDGGTVTMWSTDRTAFAGSLSARGGESGGNGGFAEVSSHKDIALTGQADLRAPRGKTGALLIDPTDLRITDAASGGSQDGNATDTSVLAADANQGSGATLNTVSRGLLESLSGTANVVLQATGQITVDAMAGGTIDLATTAGHSFTLQSTQSGGIRFSDANTQIRTQGGAITLEALGLGSSLSNIGRLSTQGGAITLRATGDIELAGALNAGAGAISLRSSVGSIANATGASPLLSGSSVSLSAPGGHVGSVGRAINTATDNLALSSGGHLVASSTNTLSSLSVTAGHVMPTEANDYQVSAPGLTFQVTDGAALAVDRITQTSPLNLTVSADRSLQLGTVHIGEATLDLRSTAGNLVGSADTMLIAASLVLNAQGSNGNNGAIGTSGQPLITAGAYLDAVSGSGGVSVANNNALVVNRLSTTGNSSITSDSTLTAGNVSVGSATLALVSSGGNVQDDGDSATRITAGTLNLTAQGSIGASGSRLSTNASTISANAGSWGIFVSTSATSSVLSSITSGNGTIDISTGGSTTLTSLTSSTSAAGNDITVTTTGPGSISVGTINAGALGDVTLTTASGSIFGNAGLITGDRVTLTSANSGSVTVRTAAKHLDVQAGSSSINITQTGAVTLDRLSTPSSSISVTSSSGDITVGSVSTSSGGTVSLTATAGSILDDGNNATRISTGTAQLSAGGAIGAPGQGVQTRATGLTASSTGDLVVTNSDATLTSLSLTNRHSAPGNAGTLQVDSPYLSFDVTDTGTSYTLDRLVSVPLTSLAFNGDATLQLGQVQAGGTVNLTATQGHITDDGTRNSRVTAGSGLTLTAAQGSVGSNSSPIDVDTAGLTLNTKGDLYVNSLTDLSSLTVNSSHPDTVTSYGMAITAPSLRLSVTDSAAGHAVHTLTDISSLTLNFTSDRDITLGRVDVTSTGTARFTSSAGAIKDDGDKNTRVLANSTTLSGTAVGAAGADHLDVVTGTLAATASAGGVYVQVPMPTGSTNTTNTVTLGTITATGPVAVTALEGDLSLGGFMTATHQAVSLTAAQGSILSPSGYSIAIGTGSLTLDAARAIGANGQALPVTSSAGATLTAQAGTSMFVSASGPMTLSSLNASAGINYTQSSGNLTVGHVDATAGGTVSLTATNGAIVDDGNGATGVRANQVSLSAAQGSVGSSGTAIAVDAPKLLVTANGTVNVTDSATLDTLSITRGSGSSGSIAVSGGAGQTFTVSEDASAHHLQQVVSATPLAFSFSGQRDVKVGSIDVGGVGSATISSAASVMNDGVPGSAIAAGTVSLTAGSAGSIGATGSGNGISLEGTTALTLRAGRNMFAASDSALADLSLTSTNTTTGAGTASQFGISGLGQTFDITDSGITQSLAFGGTALGSFSFTNSKNIQVNSVVATGDVTLATSGGGANSNISSDSGSGRIAGNRVMLTAASTTSGGGSIGSSGTALRVDTPTVIVAGSGNIYLDDAQNLARLDMTVTHGTNTTFGYGVTAGNLNSFSVTDGNTQSLGLAVTGAMDFSYSVDRALSLATVDVGTSTTGSLSLTSRSAPSGTNAQINRSSGSLTAGSISLSAVGTNGGVGAGATLSTNTKNLSIASGGNVSVSNATTLTSLSLDAQHRTSGSSTHSYSISSTGLTFSISDTIGSNAFRLANISQSGLDLTVRADRVITASSVNTGAAGKVTLQSSSYVQGGSGASAGSPSITTGDLTLNGGSAFGYQGSTPLYTAVGTLASSLSNTLYLSNAGALTLGVNTVGSSADVASSNNSLLQGTGGLFTAPVLRLSANQSLGASGALLTDARRLTLVSRGNVDVSNASDLYALSLTSTHATAGVQNSISVAAPRLALSMTDSVGGNQYHLSNLVDSSGLDFTLSTDVDLSLGTVNVQAGRALALYSTGTTTSITNDGGSLLTAGSITLSAGGSVGAAGGSGTRMQTDALSLSLATGADAYADNAQDLSSLSLTSSQTAGGTAPVYQVTAPSLSFDVTDDGTTHVNNVTDSTGLNFVLATQRDQAVGTIDVGRSGTVSLTGGGDILGDADSRRRILAASASFYVSNGGAIGSVGNPIHLSAPLASFSPTGALNVESDTYIGRLSISTTHPTVTYGGTYSIVSVPITGGAYPLFTATDSVTGTALTSLEDPLGLAFSFTSDRAMQVGTLNLGSTGTVTLTGTGSGGIVGDGDPNTRVRAASLSMTSVGGAVGAIGSGNGIDATVNTVSATAQGGGVNLALHGRTALGTVAAAGGVNLANDEGDIALGFINAGGNAVSINNPGGSILSGSIYDTTTVSLIASGSIGNSSAVGTSASGGGTTTLTAVASAAHGAAGSIAVSESYNLAAASVIAPADVTLSSGYHLSAGTVTSGGAVALASSQGSIVGIDGSNAITGTSVSLSARYGTGNGIGSSGTRLNVNTPQLELNTPGSVYVTDSADLNRLTVDRTNYASDGSSGTLSVLASGLSFSATDSSNTTTLTSLSDGTGLDFTYLGVGSLAVGSLNVGAGSLLLQAYLSSGDGHIDAINNSSLITAGRLTLQAYGWGSRIGTSGTALGTAVGSLTAASGTGGMVLRQAGSVDLHSLSTTGDLAVTATSGDLTLGTLSYGSARTLSLTASGGSILSGGGTLAGTGANAAITLSAAQGIGTATAPVLVNASAGHTLDASVTGSGSLYLSSVGTLNGGLTTSVQNGLTQVTSAGAIRLASLASLTDATGNDIRVTASAGDITAVSVTAGSGARDSGVALRANAGHLRAAPGAVLQGAEVALHGATGVGTSTDRVTASGERVQVSSNGGAIYLSAPTASVLSSVQSQGGAIDIVHSANLLLPHAASSGGAITVTSTAADATLMAGQLNAGSGAVTLSSSGTGGSLQDDGNRSTRIIGGTVTLTGAAGVGTQALSLQTQASTLNVSSGNGITIDDNRSAGVTLASVVASAGAVSVTSAGPTTATLVQALADSSGNTVTLATASGDLTLGNVSAGATQGAVNLSAAGSILAGGVGTQVSGSRASLAAGQDIGAVTDLATGAGTPIQLDVAALDALGSSGSNRVVSVHNVRSTPLTLGAGALSLGAGSSAYISAAGDLDLSAGLSLTQGNLWLTAGGTLILPTTALSTPGAVHLNGSTDVRTSAAGAAARELQVNASSLVMTSGAAGGSTLLNTHLGAIDVTLSGAGDLTVSNTGTLSATTLATNSGNISATSSTGMTAGSVVAGGAGRSINLTATTGNLLVGTVNAGTGGSIALAAPQGALVGASAALTSSSLSLISGSGIGSSGAAFGVDAATVSAQVTGTGNIHLAAGADLMLGTLSTQDGDIQVTAAGHLSANGISAGNSGTVSLTSTGGNVTLNQAYTQAGADTSRAGLNLQGQAINVGVVSTTGAQSYIGSLNAAGDLTAQTIQITGDANLSGGDRTLAGSLRVTGTLTGTGQAVTVNAGSGDVRLDGAASGLASLNVNAGNIQLANVFTSGAQTYQGATTLNGSYTTQGGAFNVLGATQLGGASNVNTGGGTARFANNVNGASALAVNTGTGLARFDGGVGITQSLASVTVSGASSLGGNVVTTGDQHYGGNATLAGNALLQGAAIRFVGALDGAHDLSINTGAGGFETVAAVGGTARLGALTINTPGATRLGSSVRAASLSTDAAGSLALDGGTVDTTGAQSYGERAVLGAHTVLTGSSVSLAAGADALASGGQSLDIQGNAVTGGALGAQQALRSLNITGSSSLGGNVTTTGAQRYGGAATLAADVVLRGNGVALEGAVDGTRSLSIDAGTGAAQLGGAVGGTARLGAITVTTSGDISFAGTVRAASVDTGTAGSLALNGGTVHTTGTQSYGQRAVLGADTTLTGSQVTLSRGADAATAGSQTLAIDGDALLDGALGAQRRLGSVAVTGRTALGADVNTRGDQRYGSAVAVNGDASLHSSEGSLVLDSTLDSASARAITLRADAGGITVSGDVGASAALGALVLRGGTLTTFNGSVRAGQVAQSFGGATRWSGPVVAQGVGGVQLSGSSQRFDGDLTAATGGIQIGLTDAAGTLAFAAGSSVQAATGFSQTGGAAVQLPASLNVTAGNITMQAPASSESARISLQTQGNITLAGLTALSSVLRISTGDGVLAIGQSQGSDAQRLAVARLEVPSAGSAELFGTLRGFSGPMAASLVDSSLVGPPYFMNATPWGPIDVIATVTALTVPVSVVPSTPWAAPLFTGLQTPQGIMPQALQQYLSPQVVTLGSLPSLPAATTAPTQPSPHSTGVLGVNRLDVPTPGKEREDLDKKP